MDLQGKRIIVTGSARGMGAATVRAYVSAGAHVYGMDLADDAGRTVAADANAKGPGKAAYLNVDIADKHSVETAFAEAVKQMGGLDALAHPAAIQRSSDAGDVSVADWDLMFAVNVRGTMLTNQVAHRYMKVSGGGSIINFGSISGQRPEPSAAAYSAAKGAVHSWTRTAAGTWGKDNIRVNAILPAMATPMYLEARARGPRIISGATIGVDNYLFPRHVRRLELPLVLKESGTRAPQRVPKQMPRRAGLQRDRGSREY